MRDQDNNSPKTKPHSKLGIASLIVALTLPTLLILCLGMVVLLESRWWFLGFIIIGLPAPLLHFVGSVLGLVGWISKKVSGFYPVMGFVLNAVLGIIGIILLYLILNNLPSNLIPY